MKLTFTMPNISLNLRAFNSADVDKLCESQISNMRFAITKNLDSALAVDGSPMKPLSAKYALKKTESGRIGHRDLNYTGDLRRSIETRAIAKGPLDRSADLYFLGSTRGDNPITFAQLASIQNERSPWFFIPKPFQDAFVQSVRDYIDRAMKSLVNP